ncbi:hypothetical protein P3T36_003197 [Kitasatospora sp. MAP12-15]|uniref:hypothetical protein n=1 Tax=unclassified Kitasatospora TaxID=2633591 RepID=UPI002475B5BE|nr:hypothetical protein [Kitasatospora sp. MAP12-44]MDH6111173.1 hypothetical protein [Kitasatospora sp. MAP12-44]
MTESSDFAGRHAARAALWLDILDRQFPELLEELVPGRPGARIRSGPAPAPAALAALAARDRADRAAALWNEQHGLTAAGGGAAPVNLHISDAVRDITDGVVELEEAVWEKLRMGRPRRADVPTRLGRLASLLGKVAEQPVLAAHVLDEVRRMARRCAGALGEAESLVRVRGRCPWCDSVSLRAFPAWRAVLCVNPGCRCTEADCGCTTSPGHRHSWQETSWGQLALDAGVDEEALAALVDDAEAEPAGSCETVEVAR